MSRIAFVLITATLFYTYLNADPARAQVAKRASVGAQGAEPLVQQLIVKYKSETARTFSASSGKAREPVLSKASGMAIGYRRPMAGLSHVYSLPQPMSKTEAYAVAKRLELSDPSIEYAEPDAIQHALVIPNDTLYANQWHYKAPDGAIALFGGINAPLAWDISRGQGVIVAVIDTGVANHPDLAANVIQGYDFISDSVHANDGNGRDADPSDAGSYAPANYCGPGVPAQSSVWHGTHVSGTIAAVTNNGVGVAGMAYESRILNLRVLGRCGSGTTSDIADAIRWAAGLAVPAVPNNINIAKIINLSLGGTGACGPTFQGAIAAASAAGSLVVAATGNDSSGQIGTPANCSGVIAVTAHTFQGDRANYANVGPGTAISAPGGGACFTPDSGTFVCLTRGNVPNKWVSSTTNTGTTIPAGSTYLGTPWQGTSMATPHIAGVAALLFSKAPTLSMTEARFLITGSARTFPANTYCPLFTDGRCGSGMLDAKAALDLQAGRTPSLVLAAPVVTPGGQTVSLQATATARNGGSASHTYSWAQTGGPTVTLVNPNSASASFVAPNPGGTHTFEATLVDGNGYVVKQTVSTKSNNFPAVVAAGPQSVMVGTPFQFRITASDPEQDPITLIAMGIPAGSTFDAATGDFVWASPGPAGTHTFSVVANDGIVNSAPVSVSVLVQAAAGFPGGNSSAPSSGGGGSIDLNLIGLVIALLLVRARFVLRSLHAVGNRCSRNCSRNFDFRILPVAPSGNDSTKATSSGICHFATLP
jgi:serine protease